MPPSSKKQTQRQRLSPAKIAQHMQSWEISQVDLQSDDALVFPITVSPVDAIRSFEAKVGYLPSVWGVDDSSDTPEYYYLGES